MARRHGDGGRDAGSGPVPLTAGRRLSALPRSGGRGGVCERRSPLDHLEQFPAGGRPGAAEGRKDSCNPGQLLS